MSKLIWFTPVHQLELDLSGDDPTQPHYSALHLRTEEVLIGFVISCRVISSLYRSFRAGLALCLVAIVSFISINYFIYVTVVTTDDNIYSSAEKLSKLGFCSRAYVK